MKSHDHMEYDDLDNKLEDMEAEGVIRSVSSNKKNQLSMNIIVNENI